MKTPLSPTTKELIFDAIVNLQRELEEHFEIATKMDESRQDFAQFYFVMHKIKGNQIKELKQILFNK